MPQNGPARTRPSSMTLMLASGGDTWSTSMGPPALDAEIATVPPRRRRDVRGRQSPELACDLPLDVASELWRRRDEDRGRCRPVLCLAEQVGCDEFRVGGLVRDHDDLGRAREEIDTDAA